MKIEVRNRLIIEDTYRANRCRSMYNVEEEEGSSFHRDFELSVDSIEWQVGVVVGPSGTGKSSIGRALWGGGHLWEPTWSDAPLVDAFGVGEPLEKVEAVLQEVGLPDQEVWLRPYAALSNGERFRADLARLVLEAPDQVVIDEFTSTVDRQIAETVASAFSLLWRMRPGQAVILTCHHDVLDWLDPDWILETNSGEFVHARGTAVDMSEFGKIPVEGRELDTLVI